MTWLTVAAVLVAVASLLALVAVLWAREIGRRLRPGTIDEEVPGRCIVITVQNVRELAMRESWAAGVLGRISPSLLEKVVYDEVAKQMREQLAAEGVEADVAIVL